MAVDRRVPVVERPVESWVQRPRPLDVYFTVEDVVGFVRVFFLNTDERVSVQTRMLARRLLSRPLPRKDSQVVPCSRQAEEPVSAQCNEASSRHKSSGTRSFKFVLIMMMATIGF